jgi:hypothetical protein
MSKKWKALAHIHGESEADLINFIVKTMSSPKGVFIGRIGGSDFEAVAHLYFNSLTKLTLALPFLYLNPLARWHLNKVRNLNGFFDKQERRSLKTLRRYLAILDGAYQEARIYLYATETLNQVIEGGKRTLLNSYLAKILPGKELLSFRFIEGVTPFMKAFEIFGEGKKILVVSPFAASVQYQWERRGELLEGLDFPNAEVATLKTSVTYNNSHDIEADSLNVSTETWVEELSDLISRVSELEFDIALLSCGSYSMPLGNFIATKLNRHAIYIGGALNPIFNISGARYETDYYRAIMRPETKLVPLEMSEYEGIAGGREYKSESLRAYLPSTDKNVSSSN